MQKVIFKLRKVKNRRTGKISHTWSEVHTNGNAVNHKYETASSRTKFLKSFIDKIKKGQYEIK